MHWLDAVSDILRAETGDLRRLAQITNSDFRNFYKGQNLSGCDLRGQDLRGFDLSDCNIDAAVIDDNTQIDPLYDPRPNDSEVYFYFRIPRRVQSSVYFYANEVGYTYMAWAYKKLFSRFNRHSVNSNLNFYVDIIKNNFNLNEICRDKDNFSSVDISILTKSSIHQSIMKLSKSNPEFNAYSLALVVGIISQNIRPRSSKNYTQFALSDFGMEGIPRKDFQRNA